MTRVPGLLVALIIMLVGVGGDCSRARVESLNHMNAGVEYAQTKRFIEAVEQLERSTAIDTTNHHAYYNLALVHMEMESFERAKDDLQRAIAIEATNAGYHEKLGTVLMELEQWEEAKLAFQKAVEVEPGLFKAYYKLAQINERLDQSQEALRLYTEAIQKGPRFLEAYSQLGRLYADLGYLDEAKQVLEGALEVAQPGSAEEANVHHLLGTVYQQQQNLDGAVDQFKSALEIEPGMRDSLFSLGWTYALQGEREEARRFLKKFVDVGADAPAHYLKAAQDRLSELGEGP